VGLRAWLGARLRAASEAGFDEETVTALIAVARRDLEKAPRDLEKESAQ